MEQLALTIGVFVAYHWEWHIYWELMIFTIAKSISVKLVFMYIQAKIGKDVDFEASLQTLRGFDSDI